MIDSHCHLDIEPLYKNLEEVLKRAEDNGVKYFLTISTDLKSFIDECKDINPDKVKRGYNTGIFVEHPLIDGKKIPVKIDHRSIFRKNEIFSIFTQQ